MKNREVGTELFHAAKWNNGQTCRS